MVILNIQEIEQKVKESKQQMGGKIFAFPINEEDPFSQYAVAIWIEGDAFKVFPEPLTISEAAAAVNETLKGFKSEGWDADYERNVRFFSHEAQINAADITMRRIKKMNEKNKQKRTNFDKDFKPNGDGYNISARGLIKFCYLSMIDDKTPKSIQFMKKYYELLSTRKYGKTAAAINQEVRKMGKDDAVEWIERTYARFIRDDMEVMGIMDNLKNEKSPR